MSFRVVGLQNQPGGRGIGLFVYINSHFSCSAFGTFLLTTGSKNARPRCAFLVKLLQRKAHFARHKLPWVCGLCLLAAWYMGGILIT